MRINNLAWYRRLCGGRWYRNRYIYHGGQGLSVRWERIFRGKNGGPCCTLSVEDYTNNHVSAEPMDPDRFVKVLIACGVQYEQLRDWKWTVTEVSPHRYHCIGDHPVAARIDIIKDGVFVH